MEIIKKVIILFGVLVLTSISANLVGRLYSYLLDLRGGFSGFIVPEFWGSFFDGFFPAYILFLSLLFTAFGGKQKYWWMGILLIPAAVVELYLDASHIYFPIALGVAGWLLGWLVAKFLPKIKLLA